MELRQLRYFLAVADELHFTRAAERLLIAAPSLSQQIKALERHLKVQLFERSSVGVGLTAAGSALLPLASATVVAADDLLAAAARLASGRTDVLRIGFQPFAFTHPVRELLAAFAHHEPDVDLQLKQFEWDDPSAGLLSDQVDLAIVRPPFRGADQLRLLEIERGPVLLVTRAGDPVARYDVLRVDQLADCAFLESPRVTDPIFAAYWYLRDINRGAPVVSHAATVEEWLTAVSLGRGVNLIPASFADDYRRPGLAFLPVDGLPDSAVTLAWKPTNTNDASRRLRRLAAR